MLLVKNPFLKPRTVSEWLLSSVCWTGACLGTWWLAWLLFDNVLSKILGGVALIGMPVSFCVAHSLIWRRAVAGGRAIIRHDEEHHDFTWLRLAANLWLVVLTVFQLACLLGPVILIAWLVLSSTPDAPTAPATSHEPFFG